jgi:hypothetical protein
LTTFEAELTSRFAALADRAEDGSWAEVVACASAAKRHRRRVPIAIAAALASAVVIVSPATGVGGKIVRLFDRAEPPPQRIVESYRRGRADLQAGRAIKVLDARMAPHMTWTLWVAPTKDGGFCEIRIDQFASEGLSPGDCYPPHVRPDDRLNLEVCLCGRRFAQDGEILAPPVVLEGATTNERAASLLLRFEDGERQPITLVWVGEPVTPRSSSTAFRSGTGRRGTSPRRSRCSPPTATSSRRGRSAGSRPGAPSPLQTSTERRHQLLLQPREPAVDRQPGCAGIVGAQVVEQHVLLDVEPRAEHEPQVVQRA